jgi:truncated hemoglobin YjbI
MLNRYFTAAAEPVLNNNGFIEVHPELRPLFRDDMAAQTKMFMYILSSAVRGLNRMQEMVGGLRALGKRHAD